MGPISRRNLIKSALAVVPAAGIIAGKSARADHPRLAQTLIFDVCVQRS